MTDLSQGLQHGVYPCLDRRLILAGEPPDQFGGQDINHTEPVRAELS